MGKIGTKKEVWDGKAEKTVGGLTKGALAKSKSGKIVSKKKQAMARARFAKSGLKPKSKEELSKMRKGKKPNVDK